MTEQEIKTNISCLAQKCILICGAGGLIGSTLAELLLLLSNRFDLGLTVCCLGRSRSAMAERFPARQGPVALQFFEGDVATVNLPAGPLDYIVQAASPAHPLAYAQTPVDVMRANLLGTANMLELARERGARLLFVSSGEVYGASSAREAAFKEEDYGYLENLAPRACYPESKRAAETLCVSHNAQYGTDTVIARLCHVYGPAITARNSRADAQFLRSALRHEPIVMKSPGTQVRSFCYVKDAAAALLCVLLKGQPAMAYNVADKNSVASIREYAQILAELSGVPIVNDFPSQTEASGYSKITRAVLDASRLEALGWTARYDLKKGLADTCRRRERSEGLYGEFESIL